MSMAQPMAASADTKSGEGAAGAIGIGIAIVACIFFCDRGSDPRPKREIDWGPIGPNDKRCPRGTFVEPSTGNYVCR